jgi:uncharacterized protein
MRTGMRSDLAAALKARDRTAVTALRSALAAIDNAEAVSADHPSPGGAENAPATGGNAHIAGSVSGLGAAEMQRRHLTDADLRSIVEQEVQERLAAAAGYEQAGRHDRAELLRAEAEVLRPHLHPAP